MKSIRENKKSDFLESRNCRGGVKESKGTTETGRSQIIGVFEDYVPGSDRDI